MKGDSVFVTGCGHQDCKDMHSWGPGIRQNYIIHYVLQGAGYLVTDGKTYFVKQGESFLTYPGKVIYYYPEETNPWEYTWVDFIGEDIPFILERTGFCNSHPVCSLEINELEHLKQYFTQLRSIDVYYHNKLEAAGLLLAILGCFADSSPALGTLAPEKRDSRLANALVLIQSNYHKSEFHIERLCSMLSTNRVALYRLFRSSLFCSPNEYLLNYRTDQAKKLLLQGFSVKQTAISCGFSDPYYFSKLFKLRTGVSPSTWKNKEKDR